MSAAQSRLAELGITLPAPVAPVGSYLPTRQVGSLLYTSGVLPMRDGELVYTGAVGDGVRIADAIQAARLCALNILALVQEHAGSLDAVDAMVQLLGFVRSAPGFTQQSRVLNGASDVLHEVLGERGRHTRMALGTADLPRGATVEISAIVRLS